MTTRTPRSLSPSRTRSSCRAQSSKLRPQSQRNERRRRTKWRALLDREHRAVAPDLGLRVGVTRSINCLCIERVRAGRNGARELVRPIVAAGRVEERHCGRARLEQLPVRCGVAPGITARRLDLVTHPLANHDPAHLAVDLLLHADLLLLVLRDLDG